MRRRKLVVALAGLTVVIAAGVVVLWPQTSRPTAEDIARIKNGMTRAEIEEILGAPGDLTTAFTRFQANDDYVGSDYVRKSENGEVVWEIWITDVQSISVRFDASQRVSDTNTLENARYYLRPLDDLEWRAKRQLHRWFP
jgi:outer membrane protein assembly factor BamE (lipoprotein component of BamABCDE complex)